MSSNELRVFISSTFTDMQPEREHLIRKVFPEIRQLCREREIVFTEIDLRWGITERQARRGKIVSTCLDEIDRHKPYVIALVGDRYGWCPTTKDIGDADRLAVRYPWISQAIDDGRSLIEMESLEALQLGPEMNGRVRFYFKSNKSGIGRNSPDRKTLREFHGRVLDSHVPCREGYRTPKQLGQWVREDLLSILEELAPETSESSWLVRERAGHEAFALSRRHAYVENERALARLDRHVHGSDSNSPLIVTGESGSGKSSLLASWSERFRKAHPDAFIVTHYVGSTPLSGDHIGLMRRVAWEVKDRYDIREEPPADPDELIREFPTWIARTQNENLVLVIDAVNQMIGMSGDTPSLGWLPEHFPSSVRTIISTIDGPVADTLARRTWPTLRVKPLSKTARRDVIRTFLQRYGKEIETRQVRRIIDERNTANPLFLRTSLEELRMFGNHAELNERIDHYLNAPDLSELFDRVLERFETDYGKAFTKEVMSALWSARNGLSEQELASIIDRPTAEVHRLLHSLEFHLMRRAGLFTFYHDHLRNAVRDRYLRSTRGRRNAYRRLASWFHTQQISRRRAEEEPWAWMQGNAEDELVECLTDPELLCEIIEKEGNVAFFRYQKNLSTEFRPALHDRVQLRCLSFSRNRSVRAFRRIRVCTAIGLLLRDAAATSAAESVIQRAYSMAFNHRKETKNSSASVQSFGMLESHMGTILQARGTYDKAENMLRSAIRTLLSSGEHDTLDYAQIIDNLASLLYSQRNYSAAEPLFAEALDIRYKHLPTNYPAVVQSLGNLGALYFGLGRLDEARANFEQSLHLCRIHLGDSHPDMAMALNNIAILNNQEGRYQEALELLRKALQVTISNYGENHPDCPDIMSNIAHFEARTHQHTQARETYQSALRMYQALYQAPHPSIARCHTNIGTLFWTHQDLDNAENEYRKALDILSHVYGDVHVSVHSCRLDIGGILFDKGDTHAARRIYEESLPIKEAVLGRDHPEVLQSYRRLEDITRSMEES